MAQHQLIQNVHLIFNFRVKLKEVNLSFSSHILKSVEMFKAEA